MLSVRRLHHTVSSQCQELNVKSIIETHDYNGRKIDDYNTKCEHPYFGTDNLNLNKTTVIQTLQVLDGKEALPEEPPDTVDSDSNVTSDDFNNQVKKKKRIAREELLMTYGSFMKTYYRNYDFVAGKRQQKFQKYRTNVKLKNTFENCFEIIPKLSETVCGNASRRQDIPQTRFYAFCPYCKRKFQNKLIFVSHKIQCQKKYMKNNSLSKKVKSTQAKIAEPVKWFSCMLCTDRFMSLNSLDTHLKYDHRPRPTCKKCKKMFDCKRRLFEHETNCAGVEAGLHCTKQSNGIVEFISSKNVLSCLKCENPFETAEMLHVHKHITNKRTPLEIIISTELLPTDLKDNLKICVKKNVTDVSLVSSSPFDYNKCQYCRRSFQNNTRLLDHVFYCQRKLIPECLHCGKFFQHAIQLKHHRKNCLQRKCNLRQIKYKYPVQCKYCNMLHKNEGELDSHLSSRHQIKTCVKCRERFDINQTDKKAEASVSRPANVVVTSKTGDLDATEFVSVGANSKSNVLEGEVELLESKNQQQLDLSLINKDQENNTFERTSDNVDQDSSYYSSSCSPPSSQYYSSSWSLISEGVEDSSYLHELDAEHAKSSAENFTKSASWIDSLQPTLIIPSTQSREPISTLTGTVIAGGSTNNFNPKSSLNGKQVARSSDAAVIKSVQPILDKPQVNEQTIKEDAVSNDLLINNEQYCRKCYSIKSEELKIKQKKNLEKFSQHLTKILKEKDLNLNPNESEALTRGSPVNIDKKYRSKRFQSRRLDCSGETVCNENKLIQPATNESVGRRFKCVKCPPQHPGYSTYGSLVRHIRKAHGSKYLMIFQRKRNASSRRNDQTQAGRKVLETTRNVENEENTTEKRHPVTSVVKSDEREKDQRKRSLSSRRNSVETSISKRVKRVDTNNDIVTCHMCGSKHRDRHNLAYHLIKVHSRIKPFSCRKCKLKFPLKSYLKYHLAKYHKVTNWKESLTNNIALDTKLHKLEMCKNCRLWFLSKYYFNMHYKACQTKMSNVDEPELPSNGSSSRKTSLFPSLPRTSREKESESLSENVAVPNNPLVNNEEESMKTSRNARRSKSIEINKNVFEETRVIKKDRNVLCDDSNKQNSSLFSTSTRKKRATSVSYDTSIYLSTSREAVREERKTRSLSQRETSTSVPLVESNSDGLPLYKCEHCDKQFHRYKKLLLHYQLCLKIFSKSRKKRNNSFKQLKPRDTVFPKNAGGSRISSDRASVVQVDSIKREDHNNSEEANCVDFDANLNSGIEEIKGSVRLDIGQSNEKSCVGSRNKYQKNILKIAHPQKRNNITHKRRNGKIKPKSQKRKIQKQISNMKKGNSLEMFGLQNETSTIFNTEISGSILCKSDTYNVREQTQVSKSRKRDSIILSEKVLSIYENVAKLGELSPVNSEGISLEKSYGDLFTSSCPPADLDFSSDAYSKVHTERSTSVIVCEDTQLTNSIIEEQQEVLTNKDIQIDKLDIKRKLQLVKLQRLSFSPPEKAKQDDNQTEKFSRNNSNKCQISSIDSIHENKDQLSNLQKDMCNKTNEANAIYPQNSHTGTIEKIITEKTDNFEMSGSKLTHIYEEIRTEGLNNDLKKIRKSTRVRRDSIKTVFLNKSCNEDAKKSDNVNDPSIKQRKNQNEVDLNNITNPNTTIYFCHICKVNFDCEKSLEYHLHSYHNEKMILVNGDNSDVYKRAKSTRLVPNSEIKTHDMAKCNEPIQQKDHLEKLKTIINLNFQVSDKPPETNVLNQILSKNIELVKCPVSKSENGIINKTRRKRKQSSPRRITVNYIKQRSNEFFERNLFDVINDVDPKQKR